ncbi:MAG: hypothetical protein U0984_09770 [Prosthecobacter sp.]|nr:hypothetical protein [Prosthecobacter sp.]
MKKTFGLGSLLLLIVAASLAEPPRPRLQIINGSDQAVAIFWLKPGGERIEQGTLPIGKDKVITTTLGHEFLLVGQRDHHEIKVTSALAVQACRYPEAVNFLPLPDDGQVVRPPAALAIPSFYTQYISAHGFPIVGSAKVDPHALKEAAFLANQMLDHRLDVRNAMIRSGARMCIIAHNEFTTDLPEFAHLTRPPGYEALSDKDYWDARARGTGGSQTDPYCTSAEENLLGYPGDPYSQECILIHEFAHNIHLRGMANVDPTFDRRLKETYENAMAQGLWRGKYPSVNHHEYFAEGVQSWFDDNRENDHDHNHVNTRAELLTYDPGLAAICREVFGDTVIKYQKPATRLAGHMAGYDPAKAPTFTWPSRLQKARDLIRQKVAERAQDATEDQ